MMSRACEYAVQALLDLVDQPEGVLIPVRDVAARCGIPYPFLGKIVQQLTRRGLLTAARGPNGGIALASPANEMTLLQIVEAIDGLDIATRCVIGLPSCQDARPCPLHLDWGKVRTQLLGMLTKKTLMELATETRLRQSAVSA